MCPFGDWRREQHGFHPGGPPWAAGLPGKRRFIFWRLAAAFGLLAFLFLVALCAVIFLAFEPSRPGLQRPLALLLAGGVVPFAFLVVSTLVGVLVMRRLGRPIAEVMAAADAVADGDLSVRVREDNPGELGRLGRSFNRMTAELARAEQGRRNLTADVAHELRNPLHVIQGNLEGILDGVYEPDVEHIAATLDETRLLARLVNDLQTLTLAESGQLPLHSVRFSARDLLEDVATSFAGQAAEAGVQLVVDPAVEGEGLEIEADPDRLDQVLSNLVSNSLRHTDRGGRICLRALPLVDGVRIEVQDSGAGIPAEDLPYIFDRFWRGDRSRARRAGTGSGLGLPIARQLVQAHGGRIAVASQPGQGTTFTIDLPAGR